DRVARRARRARAADAPAPGAAPGVRARWRAAARRGRRAEGARRDRHGGTLRIGARHPCAQGATVSDERKSDDLPKERLEALERMAVELATVAGAQIVHAFGGVLAVRYKGGDPREEYDVYRDPVS